MTVMILKDTILASSFKLCLTHIVWVFFKFNYMKIRGLICRIFDHKWKQPFKSTEGQEWYVCDRCLKQEYRRY